MQILGVINQKGGVGKTTTAITIADIFAVTGYRVLLIDLDGQGHVSESIGMDPWPGLYDFIVRESGAGAILPSGRDHLDVIGSDHTAVQVRQNLTGRAFGESVLARLVRGLKDYDVIFLDVAPGIDILQVSALTAATHFIVPVQLDHLAISGASKALGSAATLLEVGNLNAEFVGILPTFWERTTNETIVQLERLIGTFGQSLVWEPIPRDTKFREASAYGKTLREYAPASRGMMGIKIEGRTLGGYNRAAARLIKEMQLCDAK